MTGTPSRGALSLVWLLTALVLALGLWRLASLHHPRSADQQKLIRDSRSHEPPSTRP